MAKAKKSEPEIKLSDIFEQQDTNDSPLSQSGDEEFDRLLNEFISQELSDVDIDVKIEEKKEAAQAPKKPAAVLKPSQDSKDAPASTAAAAPVKTKPTPQVYLYEEEKALFTAYKNFISAIELMSKQHSLKTPAFQITAEYLQPRYKPTVSKFFIEDTLKGWDIMLAAHKDSLLNLQPNASDDDLLNFAEKATDETLQLAVISYVEILIEMEGCEIAYEDRRVRAKKRMIERKIIEEHEARQAKIKKYIQLIEEQKFPINSERLVINYFKNARKDPVGAHTILINNPATYAPIEINKIPSRFFGLIKTKPEDGIRFNKIIGNFLKKLKA